LITIVTVLLIELLTVLVVLGYFLLNQSSIQIASLRSQAVQALPYFVHSEPDRMALTKWLEITAKTIGPQTDVHARGFLCVVDAHYNVLSSIGHDAPAIATPLNLDASTLSSTQLSALLTGRTSAITLEEPHNLQLFAVPIQDDQQRPVGALVALVPQLNMASAFNSLGRLAAIGGVNLLLLTLLIGVVGTVFGFLTARGLTRRFTHLALAADHWSKGDFSLLIKDPAPDEVGQLARRMDRMAEQLQQLFRTRQQLATMEERNRLARDLHDSVKQQLFSVAMQLGALRRLLTRNTEKAQLRLAEIERTVKLAQQELTALIHELRPIALEDRSLAQALQDLATRWTEQTWIAVQVELTPDESYQHGQLERLPIEVEDALFRIAQEALSNVARHSNATQVSVRLDRTVDAVSLTISDNGRGFSATRDELVARSGLGLRSMQERIEALDGSFEIQSVEGSGTRVLVCCPLRSAVAPVHDIPEAK
jgi:NarL family two-component system sensor histidine kinase LiaS